MSKNNSPNYGKKLEYKTMDQRSHVLHRPGMYIGSTKPIKKEIYIALIDEDKENDNKKYQIIKKEIEYIPGLDRIFIECLSNAIDNVWRSREFNITPTKIKININQETGETSIWNDGFFIPCEKNEETGLYNVEMIFGKLLSGSNYNDEEERKTSGLNGIGAKAASIFSTKFTVKTIDPEKGKIYEQTWEDNMLKKSEPRITSTKLKTGSTEVIFYPDFSRFSCKGYSDDMLSIIYKHVIDSAMITKIAVYLNDEKIPIKSLSDYAKLYLIKKEEIEDDDDEDEKKSKNKEEFLYIENSDSEVVLIPNDDINPDFDVISFVNGIETFDGGVHVDAWSNAIFKPIVEKINDSGKKGTPQITLKDVKQFFKLFVNANVDKPEFSSQEKTKLTSPNIKTKIDQKQINAILKWDAIERVRDIIRSKELLTLKKTEKKKGFKKIEGYDPANNAGGKLSMDCTLILCEGLSAKTYAVCGIEVGAFGKQGRDYFGILPLRGKVLNTRNANVTTISKNKEITDLIQALGLRYGIDYSDDKNFETLNYGRVLLLTDADDDGIHISGLIMNFIHSLFPSLIKREKAFLLTLKTPLIRINNKNNNKIFYSLAEYNKYIIQHEDQRGKVKYYKGLGTSNDKEVKETFGKKLVQYTSDEKTDESINKVFHTKFADTRKKWLESHNPEYIFEAEEKNNIANMPFSDFMNYEMIKFSISDCKRSIPNLLDGLKESQRKILYACFLKNLKTSGKTMKVAQLAGFVAEKTNYHHGEQCLFDTITKMAQDFVGSNNIPFLYKDGQFGSRSLNGNDAASARYIFTKLEILTRLIFRQEDDDILERVEDDGELVEPKFYLPIIPTILINGCSGIGTGWSCNIPSFNPLDLVKCVKIWLEEHKIFEDDEKTFSRLPDLIPWYRGFQGKIERVSDHKFVTYGILEQDKNKAVITEIPINMSIDKFKENVETLLEEKQIKGYKNYSTPNKVNIEIQQTRDGKKCNIENLKLKSNLLTSNMVLFTEKGTLHKFLSTDEIIDHFCNIRYQYYILRKKNILKGLKDELKWAENKLKFLSEVMDEKLILKDKEEKEIIQDLEKRGYDSKIENDEEGDDNIKKFRYLLDMKIRSFSKQKLEELKNEIQNLKKKIKEIDDTSEDKMWLNDLEEFEKAYKTWINNKDKEEGNKIKKTKTKKKEESDSESDL